MPAFKPNRVHKGVPAGGRFAEKKTPEATVSLKSPSSAPESRVGASVWPGEVQPGSSTEAEGEVQVPTKHGEKVEAARNPFTSKLVLRDLASDRSGGVRWRVAANENTHPVTLGGLANDRRGYVRSHVAENPNTYPATLERLASDKNLDVRDSVSRNPNTPDEALKKLAGEGDEEVRDQARDELRRRRLL